MNDTEACAPCEGMAADSRDEQPPPDLLQAIVSLWRQLLGHDRIQLDDNFFQLGGNSVLGMKLLENLDATLAVQLPLVTLFQAPTIRELAQAITEAKRI